MCLIMLLSIQESPLSRSLLDVTRINIREPCTGEMRTSIQKARSGEDSQTCRGGSQIKSRPTSKTWIRMYKIQSHLGIVTQTRAIATLVHKISSMKIRQITRNHGNPKVELVGTWQTKGWCLAPRNTVVTFPETYWNVSLSYTLYRR